MHSSDISKSSFCIFFIFILSSGYLPCFYGSCQNVKAYLRRGTAREMLGYYKEAIEGLSLTHMDTTHYSHMLTCFNHGLLIVIEISYPFI